MKAAASTIAAMLVLASTQPGFAQQQANPPAAGPPVVAAVETAATMGSGADGAVVLPDPADPARILIFAGAGSAGIDVFGSDGRRIATHAAGNIVALDARADSAPGGGALLVCSTGLPTRRWCFGWEGAACPIRSRSTGSRPR